MASNQPNESTVILSEAEDLRSMCTYEHFMNGWRNYGVAGLGPSPVGS